MRQYEALYILKADLNEEAYAQTNEKVAAWVKDNGGTVNSVDNWGRRKLAYPINKETEGFYVLMKFEADTTFPKELERLMHISEGVLRCLVMATE